VQCVWAIESTFHEVRTHLGLETARGWSTLTVQRTTPVLLALFSLVTLLAHDRLQIAPDALSIRQAAWYHKQTPTFSDALALVRRHLWSQITSDTSPFDHDSTQIPQAFVDHLCSLLSYAA